MKTKLIIGFVLGAALTFGIGVLAQNVAENGLTVNGNYYAGQVDVDAIVQTVMDKISEQASDTFGGSPMLGGTSHFGYDVQFNSGTTDTFAGSSIFTGTVSGDATTTPSHSTYSGIDISLTQVASTTAGTSTAGYWCNSGSPIVVYDWNWRIRTANGLWPSNWTIGTTTLRDGSSVYTAGTNSFTNTSTATLVASSPIATSTTGYWSLDGYADAMYSGLYGQTIATAAGTTTIGSYYTGGYGSKAGARFFATSTPFDLLSGECIVVFSDQSSATSSASYTAAGGFTTLVGTFHGDIYLR